MRTVGRAVWAFVSFEAGLPAALLCVLLGAVAGHVVWNRWP